LKLKNKKTMKNSLLYKSLFVVLFWFLIPGTLIAQNYSATKSVSKSTVVPASVKIDLSNMSADLKINTTNENTVSIKTDIKVEGKSKEDVDKVIKAIENFKFELSGNTLEIDTRFYKSMMNTGFKSTMTLLDGEKADIKEFEVRHELYIPKTAVLKLDNKYSDVEIQDLDGEADFSLYSTTINAGNFGAGKTKLDMKYSKAYMGNFKNVDFNLYDSDVVIKNSGDVKIVSKYSKFDADKTNNLAIDSYDDKYKVQAVLNVEAKAKYSDFDFPADLNKIKLDLYDSNLKAKNAIEGIYTGKYSELSFESIKTIEIPASFDDKFEFGKTKQIKVNESKYSEYILGQVSSFILIGYDDNIAISELANNFEGPVDVNGKYIKLNINAGNVPYQLFFKIKYPKINIPDNVVISKKIQENSDLELVGNSSGGKIIVNGYDMVVNIK
jgi:hypothetical protein